MESPNREALKNADAELLSERLTIVPDCAFTTTSRAMNDALEQLELKLAFLERANNELSDVVYRQQQELDALRARVAALTDRMEAIKDEPTAYTIEQERPPHY